MTHDSASSPVPAVDIDGVPIASLTSAEVVSYITAAISERKPGGVVITANADQMTRLHSVEYRDLVRSARLIVPDGMPLVWASKIQRTPLPERVNGTNLLTALCAAAAESQVRVFLLGAGPGVAQEAAEVLAARFPGLAVCGTLSPRYGFETDADQWAAVAGAVVDSRPDLVFVALGHPKQEFVGVRLARDLPLAWFIGCGGALDLLAGRVKRAPSIFQRLGAEWLHRLSQEPKRLARRYLVDDLPYVLRLLYRSWRKGRQSPR